MFERLKALFSPASHEAEFQASLERLRARAPVPVFWLFGKTQSGKTSLVKYLTGAEDAEVGKGFRPCTRFSREYAFPTHEAPLLTFLDTRGVDEPGYDPAEDLRQFNERAHLVIVTVRLLDHALDRLRGHLDVIRRARADRPIVVVATCLHEAYPQQDHPEPYPFVEGNTTTPNGDARVASVRRALDEQRRRFEGVATHLVAVDLTAAGEGFRDPAYGGHELKQAVLDVLPEAYRQTLLTLNEATEALDDLFARRTLPHIAGYSTLAATAGAIPVPWVDLLILPGIQTRMIYHLARLYGQPLTATRFLELAGTLGSGIVMRQGVRELVKLIPYAGSVAGGALAGASTFALGKAFCFYYRAVHKGHVPKAEELKRYYQEQLALAERHWIPARRATPASPGAPPS